MSTINWCKKCNIPLVNRKTCSLCNNPTKIIVSNSENFKPIFCKENKFYNEIIDKSLNINDDLVPNGCFIYNKIIIGDGEKNFKLLFNAQKSQWGATAYNEYNVGDIKGTNFDLMIKANLNYMKRKEKKAIKFIKNLFKKCSLPFVVSFSGGKDSLCIISLVKQIKKDIPIIYLNTTIEFPDNISYIKNLKDKFNFNIIEIKPEKDFYTLSKYLGPPSRFNPWCCQTLKFTPMNKFINNNFKEGVVCIQGLRRSESHSRKNYKPIMKNKIIPKQIIASPILDWSSFDVWLYLLWKKLPINPVYKNGIPRVGCMICPNKSPAIFSLTKKFYPKQAKKWNSILISYAKKNDYDSSWVSSGNWMLRSEKYEKIPKFICKFQTNSEETGFYLINDLIVIKKIIEFLKVFGECTKIDNNIFRINNKNIDILIIGNKIKIICNKNLYKRLFEKQLSRAINCVSCGACMSNCNAINIKNSNLKIDSKKCIHCLNCLTSKNIRMSCISLNYRKQRYILKERKETQPNTIMTT